MTRALTADLATAANPARGGLVREALAAHFPRLTQLLEDALGRLARDTQARGLFYRFWGLWSGLGVLHSPDSEHAELDVEVRATQLPRLAQLRECALACWRTTCGRAVSLRNSVKALPGLRARAAPCVSAASALQVPPLLEGDSRPRRRSPQLPAQSFCIGA